MAVFSQLLNVSASIGFCVAGLLTDLFRIAANHLAFSDLMMIFFGQPSSLERLQEPLREFISQNLLNGDPPSDASINAAVERVIQDMRSDISSVAVCKMSFSYLASC
jgi:hypothetical protein